MRFQIVLFLILALVGSIFAQSGRPAANVSDQTTNVVSVRQMYEEADGYAKKKFAEYYQKKIPFSEKLQNQTFAEQKKLAAKYASAQSARKDLAGEDFYYLALLHWIAENLDGTAESFRLFLKVENAAPEKMQISRSILTIVEARRKNFDEAEKTLADYLKNSPVKSTERARMESELAENYHAAKSFPQASRHADELLDTQKKVFAESNSRATSPMLDALLTAFEIYRDAGENAEKKADATLEEAKNLAAAAGTPAVYFLALNDQITYQIETGRKPLAFQTFQNAPAQLKKDFAQIPPQNYVLERLKRRETQYRLLGDPAPELLDVQWFPGKPQTLESLRGKVVLIDFWATWCGPCLQSFPALAEMHDDFSGKGLIVLGLTRFYTAKYNVPTEEAAEIQTLASFRQEQKLPYNFLVSREQDNQLNYGAVALPTTVLIDKKGIVRYLESGTSKAREEEIRRMVEKLLAEK